MQPEIIPIKTKKVPHFPPHKPLISPPLSPSRHLAMVRSGNNANNTRGPQRSMATAKMMKDVVIVIVTITYNNFNNTGDQPHDDYKEDLIVLLAITLN